MKIIINVDDDKIARVLNTLGTLGVRDVSIVLDEVNRAAAWDFIAKRDVANRAAEITWDSTETGPIGTPCPKCHVGPGQLCVTRTGKTSTSYHRPRVDAFDRDRRDS